MLKPILTSVVVFLLSLATTGGLFYRISTPLLDVTQKAGEELPAKADGALPANDGKELPADASAGEEVSSAPEAATPIPDESDAVVSSPLKDEASTEVPSEKSARVKESTRVEPKKSATENAKKAVDDATWARFGKIFAELKPNDAAAMMEFVRDEEARVILLRLPPRNAAAVLSKLPRERAARLSQAMIPAELVASVPPRNP